MGYIIYEDSSVIVAKKPSGILSEGEAADCFPAILSKELEEKNKKPKAIYTVHRLDRETEGLMVYALSSPSAASLSSQIQKGEFKKQYTARLSGIPEQSKGRLCDLLYYDRKSGKSFIAKKDRRGVKEAILEYSVEEINDGKALVKIDLLTGRTHQIRVQFASRSLPICGDRRYGAAKEFGNKLLLCATSLSFKHPMTGKTMSFCIDTSELLW